MAQNTDSAGQAEETDNLSVEDLVTSSLIDQEVEATEEETEEEATEDEESEETETEETEEETETDEDEESEEEEESETTQTLDLDNMSEDDLVALAKRLPKSGSLKRINQLIQRAKEAEAKVTFLEGSVKAQPTSTNPFGHLSTKEEVETKKGELEDVIDKTEELLDENVGLGADDLIEYQGKEFTVRDVRAANRNSRKALDKLIPARLAEIAENSGIAATREEAVKAVAEKFPEFADEDSNISKSYRSMMEGEDVTVLETKHPKLWAQMPGILALAAVGLDVKVGKSRTKVTTTGKRPKVKAPSSPVGSGTQSSSSRKSGSKEAAKQFEESGSVEDLERMLMEGDS